MFRASWVTISRLAKVTQFFRQMQIKRLLACDVIRIEPRPAWLISDRHVLYIGLRYGDCFGYLIRHRQESRHAADDAAFLNEPER
jgi:hypothetical protein